MVNSTVSSTPNPKSSPNLNHPKRPPLLMSETAAEPPPRRKVNSKYNQSSSSSSLSSSFSSNSSISSSFSSRRSQSPMKPRGRNEAVEVSNAARVLMTSTRSLSVSFQGESFKLPVSKAAAKPAPIRGTPERARVSSVVKDHVENVKIGDQYRWPGRSKAINSSILTKSLDFGSDKSKLFGSSNRIRDMHNSRSDNDKSKKGTRLKSESIKAQCDDDADSGSISIKSVDSLVDNGKCKKGNKLKTCETQCVDDANCGSISIKSVDSMISDSDTASSGSVGMVRGGKRGIVVPARFLQDVNSRVRKEVEITSGTPKSKSNESKGQRASTPIGAKMYLPQTPVSLLKVEPLSGRFVSPVRGGTRLASISKGVGSLVNCPSPRGRPSPTRTKNGMPNVSPSPRGRPSPTRINNGMANVSRDNATPSILSFTTDMRRARVGESRVNDAHELRMIYNRQLQWRFINARAQAALLVQSGTAERSLYNAWVTISKLRHSIRSKRIQLQLLRQNLKLYSIMKGQAPYLESWSLIESDHCISLSEARQALQTSIANLPLVDGSRADTQLLKTAICSAADVMEGMTSSVGSQLIMVEQVSSLAYELANTTASGISLIEQGRNLMSALSALQVYDCSLKTHILQLPREASSLATQV